MKLSFPLSPIRVLALGALLVGTTECSVSERVQEHPGSQSTATSKEVLRQNLAYEQVLFRLNFMDEARLNGQDILFVRQADDFTSQQQSQLQAALQAGKLPLRLRMRIFVRNPSTETIQLQQLGYQLRLDGRSLASGVTGANTELQPSDIVTLPVDLDINLTPDLMRGRTPAVFGAGLTDFTTKNRRLTMYIRPTYVNPAGRISRTTSYEPIDLVTVKAPKPEKAPKL